MEEEYFICLHEFVPEFEDELALLPGDKIVVLPSDAGEDVEAWLMVNKNIRNFCPF